MAAERTGQAGVKLNLNINDDADEHAANRPGVVRHATMRSVASQMHSVMTPGFNALAQHKGRIYRGSRCFAGKPMHHLGVVVVRCNCVKSVSHGSVAATDDTATRLDSLALHEFLIQWPGRVFAGEPVQHLHPFGVRGRFPTWANRV